MTSRPPRQTTPDELPHDIITEEILPKLPPNSLLRFKLVCKKWRDLINHPDFIHAHLLHHSRSNRQLNVLFTNQGKLHSRTIKTCVSSSSSSSSSIEVARNPLPSNCFDLHKHREPIFWGSCNGLICLQTGDYELGLWNPCTGSYTALPYHPPIRAPASYGFGYDAETKDYKLVKIVSIINNTTDPQVQVWVFTLNSNSWRAISSYDDDNDDDDDCAVCTAVGAAPGKYINDDDRGVVYWVGEGLLDKLICFDIRDEVFSVLMLPNISSIITQEISGIEICDIDGCLALARELNCEAGMILHEVWLKKENWIKMYSVDASRSRYWIDIENIMPLGGIDIVEKKKNEKNEIKERRVERVIYMGKCGWRSCFSFHSRTKQFMRFPFPDASRYFAKYGSIITYVESLVSINPEKEP
ncbi:hypothetical protein Syun_007763 [Stephania yunnanensis]|uniref:F-box domain-containing protein n=1 Tax=Stephania yunnanensis TaxID=152371 RepID=A0AAP0PYT7_9MAGN